MNVDEAVPSTGAGAKRKRNAGDDHDESGVSFECLVSPNFEELARVFPDFGRAWRTVQQSQAASGGAFSSHINQEFSIALTKALLHVHWGLSLPHLPPHHLCPPVPNRYFFVKWIQQDLLPLLTRSDVFDPVRSRLSRTGLDIGTGATCIYPLLYASSDPSYRIYGTDIEPESVQLAAANVESNSLQSRVAVVQVPPIDSSQVGNGSDASGHRPHVGPLRQSLNALPTEDTSLDFVMTNPPFFDDDNPASNSVERTEPRKGDGRSRTAMTVSEGSYPGGEVGFVQDMMLDTLLLYAENRTVPGWTCCMCGKKSSWIKLKHMACSLFGTAHVRATEFGPGHMTRWFLAWTLERPNVRSPVANMEQWQFSVPLDGIQSHENADEEVVRRIQQYCQSLPGYDRALRVEPVRDPSMPGKWIITIQEAFPSPAWLDDSSLPEPMQNALASRLEKDQRRKLLPIQGHFLLDVTVAKAPTAVQVQFVAYEHSSYGKKAVEKIKSQAQGEICRTNRRWRRRLKREQEQQQQIQQTQSMEE